MLFFSWLFRKKNQRQVAAPVALDHDTVRPVLVVLSDILEEPGITSAPVTTQSTLGDLLVVLGDDEHYARNVVVELSKRLGCWVEPTDTLASIAKRRRW